MKQNEAISLADAVYDNFLRIANGCKDPWHRTELRNSAYAVREALEALRPLLNQTSAGVGDGGYGIIDAIEWADGVAGALGSEYASRVTDEEIAVAMAIKSALTQADQPASEKGYPYQDHMDAFEKRLVEQADKDDRRDLLDKIDRTLDYFRDEFPGEKDVWADPISAYAGGISANDLLKIKRALSGPEPVEKSPYRDPEWNDLYPNDGRE